MQMSDIGRAVLEAREGRCLTAYQDSKGVWTIGIGVTTIDGRPVHKGMTLSEAECDRLFVATLAAYEAAVGAAVKVPLADHEADALISFAYNVGTKGMAGSTAVRKLNAGDRSGAATALMLWIKPPEIKTRRQAEHDQFLTPYAAGLPKARSTDAKPVVVQAAAPADPGVCSTCGKRLAA